MNISVDVLDPRVEEQVQRDNVIHVLVVISLIVYAYFGNGIMAGILLALGMMYIIPSDKVKRLLGYLIPVDIAFSYWIIGVAAATLGGLHIAITGQILFSMITREFRLAWGYEKLAVNGKIGYSDIFAELLSQAGRWTRSIYNGLRHNTQIDPPPALAYTWETGDEGGGFKATRTYRSGAWLLSAIPRAINWAAKTVYRSFRTDMTVLKA